MFSYVVFKEKQSSLIFTSLTLPLFDFQFAELCQCPVRVVTQACPETLRDQSF